MKDGSATDGAAKDGAAPFFADLADGPPGGRAVWLRTEDGVRIRVGLWRGGEKGTVVLLPGRTEYIEKYGRAGLRVALGLEAVEVVGACIISPVVRGSGVRGGWDVVGSRVAGGGVVGGWWCADRW